MKNSGYIGEIEKLSKVMDENNLMSVHYNEGTFSINLTKNHSFGGWGQTQTFAAVARDGTGVETVNASMRDFGVAHEGGGDGNGSVSGSGNAVEVKAPMVGVFFNAPAPDSEPFVKVGDSVKKGDVLCILEAMKLMNEIPAESAGTISEICVKNGDVVEYGQVLFKIEI
jgi:acetyl-CoA carboxylase biotin carboxyl carrier protein